MAHLTQSDERQAVWVSHGHTPPRTTASRETARPVRNAVQGQLGRSAPERALARGGTVSYTPGARGE